MYNPKSVIENETHKLLWDFEIQTNHLISPKTTRSSDKVGSWRTSEDHPSYIIVENGQNTEKSPADFRRLAVIQTPVKNHQLTLM